MADPVKVTRDEFNCQVHSLIASQQTLWMERSRTDALLVNHTWLQASLRLRSGGCAVALTCYVYFNENYQQPQLGLLPSTLDGSEDDDDEDGECVRDGALLQRFFPRLNLLTFAQDMDTEKSSRPIASYGFCEEVDAPMWSIHPCDTTKLISCGRLDGLTGSVLFVFLHAIAPFVEWAGLGLLPPMPP